MKLKIKLLTLLLALPLFASAQNQVEMADVMRQEGKIYVVVAVLVIILTGMFVYLFTIDKKVSRLLKERNERMEK